MMTLIQLEVFINNQWQTIGNVEVPTNLLTKGYKAPGTFNYEFEYLDQQGLFLQTNGYFAASLRYPLDYGSFQEKSWPAFLLDLIPTGAARENLLKVLKIADGPGADFTILSQGAINPPGNLRVKNDKNLFPSKNEHPGFSYQEVVSRGVDFIDYAERMGAIVSGTSGAQGVAPKFLLVQDELGNWHGDGAIADHRIQASWLVKFPRGKKKRDYQIILAESHYYEVARELGIRTLGPLKWDNDALFIPRFDRQKKTDGTIIRFGLESLISAAGVSEFGAVISNEEYISIIHRYATHPKSEILEYIFRDFLNSVCGNTDNHGRNTAFIKMPEGTIELSPLFDFAPMVLDDSGIARVSRWKSESAQIPEFKTIADTLRTHNFEIDEIRKFFNEVLAKLMNLQTLLNRFGVEEEVIKIATRKYDLFLKTLENFVEDL
jgi:serine/threonine-protein kinase HipA